MEVQDLLKKRTQNPIITLDRSTFSVTPKISSKMRQDFKAGTPFAYLLEFSEFYGRKFYINSNVLIPRNETELLVDLIKNSGKKFERVLDIGTGSGIIVLSLLAEGVGKTGVGVDLSSEALHVARTNVQRLRLQDKVDFVLSDRLEKVKGKFDLIVSNPPYIKETSHKTLVHHQVHEFEPHMALYLTDDEYEAWFKTFFTQVFNALLPGGMFVMEGHELELQNQCKELLNLGFDKVEVLQDYCGNDRFLMAHRNN